MTDAHVHLLSEKNRLAPAEEFSSEGEILRAEMTLPAARRVWQRATLEELLAENQRSGIQRNLVFGFPWRDPQRCRWDNDYVQACVQAHPARLRGLAVFQPSHPGSLEEVESRLASGHFLGVKIKAQWQGHSLLDTELWRPVLERVEAQAGIALVHVEQVPKPARGNGPHEFFHFARSFPRVRIIAAHFGAMVGLYEAHAPFREQLQHVVYDTALGTLGTVTSAYLAAGLESKIVFGSDFPMHSQGQFLESLQALEHKPREAICRHNLARWWPEQGGFRASAKQSR